MRRTQQSTCTPSGRYDRAWTAPPTSRTPGRCPCDSGRTGSSRSLPQDQQATTSATTTREEKVGAENQTHTTQPNKRSERRSEGGGGSSLDEYTLHTPHNRKRSNAVSQHAVNVGLAASATTKPVAMPLPCSSRRSPRNKPREQSWRDTPHDNPNLRPRASSVVLVLPNMPSTCTRFHWQKSVTETRGHEPATSRNHALHHINAHNATQTFAALSNYIRSIFLDVLAALPPRTQPEAGLSVDQSTGEETCTVRRS